jgi:hypothetical protein
MEAGKGREGGGLDRRKKRDEIKGKGKEVTCFEHSVDALALQCDAGDDRNIT